MNFKELIALLKNKKVLCLPHKHADLDAISSAAIASKIFNADIGLIDKPTDFAFNFIEAFNIKVLNHFDYKIYDYIIYTDGCDLKQFCGITAKKAIIIDHHLGVVCQKIPNVIYSKIVDKNTFPACTYLYYKLCQENNITITSNFASYILAGLIGDKAIHKANTTLRKEVNNLIDISGLDIQYFLAINSHRPVQNKKELSNYIKLLNSADLVNIKNYSILFLDAAKRDYFYFLFDNFLSHFSFDLLVCRAFDEDEKYIRFEKCSKKLADKINIHEFLVYIKKKLWYDEYSEIFRRFKTDMDFKDVKEVLVTELKKVLEND